MTFNSAACTTDPAVEWKSIVRFLRSKNVGELSYAHFSQAVTINCPKSMQHDPLDFLLRDELEQLHKLKGFGKKKVNQTYDNMLAIATHLGWNAKWDIAPRSDEAEQSVEAARVSLHPFGLPESFPARATFLSERSLHYCESAGLHTIIGLVEAARAPDWSSGAGSFRNMGKRSIGEIRSFAEALVSRDRPAIREFLPIRMAGSGIDYGAAAVQEAQRHTQVGLEGIMQRVVHGQTLERVAGQCRVTRERIRQVESLVVERVESLLAAMSEDRAILWKEWTETGCLASIASDQAVEADRLGACVIDKIFAESAEGKDWITNRDQRSEAFVSLMELQPAFYLGELKLCDFLSDQQNELTPRLLLSWNVQRPAFSYDQITGCAKALSPKTKRVVQALLFQGEKNATEVLEFLRKLEVADDWEIKDLKRNYLHWCEESDFAANRLVFNPSAALKSRAESLGLSAFLGSLLEEAATLLHRFRYLVIWNSFFYTGVNIVPRKK